MTQQRRKKRQGRSRDPQAEREARRYERPIPSRELILQRLEKHDRPMGFEAIARDLGLREAVDRDALERRLGAMVRDGQLIRNRRDDFCLAERVGVVTGSVIGHRDGFGFLSPEDGGEDVFLSPRQMRSLMHNDRAAVRVRRTRDGRLEGSLVDVLERNTHELVGRYIEEQGIGFVIPDNSRYSQDVLVPAGQRGEARAGQIVEVEIIEQPDRRTQPLGRVIRVLGEHRAPGMEVEIAIASHGLPHGFGSGVHSEVAGLSEQVPEAAKRGREDLRELPLVTIDGADARDFDDAVFCERRGEGWRLIVAIADVSHYVVPDTALDAEARERGTSVYFPDRVIPMLPEVLSNGLCSLNPEVDRLCMACEMQVDARGKVIRSRFLEGVMRSHARLTYDEVAEIVVDGKVEARRRREPLVAHLDHLYELYKVLAGARRRRGAIDFDSVETRIEFGPAPEREVRRIVPLERNDAHKLIEECMIAANVEAARFLKRKRVPTLFRIHEGPDPDKLEDLRDFLGQLGISMGGGDKPQARPSARVLRDIQ
ncbi:MAG: VacB/RNase II family 3'-5' exoribonuclease, partial [Gammaproteobacteria bacterium]